ncbi:dTDP-glucose 4,6-dehydratase [Candidatus Omnitrophota bacterium]
MSEERRILVTGGAGFIGSNFIRYLLRSAAGGRGRTKIVNLDKLTYSGNPDNLKDVEKDRRYRFVKGDICDRRLAFDLVKKCDFVVNFAAETHVDRSIRDSTAFIKTNILGTQVLMDAARNALASKGGRFKKFIQIGTDEVYGSVLRGYSDEGSPLLPNSPYAASKAAADLLVRSYYITYGFPAVITRSSNNFGPYQYPEKMIPLFITNLLEGRKVPLYADGSNMRDWIYVGDNCAAVSFVLDKGRPGEIYNIGGGNELKNIELTRSILKTLKRPESFIRYVRDRPGHDKRYALDSSKLHSLGWRPASGGMREKLKHTLEWYRKNVRWWKRLKKKKEKFW